MMYDRVLIVSKTKMFDHVCVGGITDKKQAVRLLTHSGDNQLQNTPLKIGQVWDITYQKPSHIDPPHVEDIHVQSQKYEKTVPDLRETIEKMFKGLIWEGAITSLYDGKLEFTGGGSGYITRENGIPDRSTWFWHLDKDMELVTEREGKEYYRYHNDFHHKIKYVGLEPHRDILKKDQLLRVSLARWWSPRDSEDEERCYLQLSGWY